VRTIQPAADKKRISVSLDIKSRLQTIKADREKLRNIILNLLENAVKFSPNNGNVQVTMDVLDRENITLHFGPEAMDQMMGDQQHFFRIAVSDNGVGLKSEDRDRIFTIPAEADTSGERPFDGTGLSLTVSRKLIELHSGRIWAESRGEGKGSLFTIVLPLPKDAFREGIPLSDFLN
jgi:signal transduction histidine kinase